MATICTLRHFLAICRSLYVSRRWCSWHRVSIGSWVLRQPSSVACERTQLSCRIGSKRAPLPVAHCCQYAHQRYSRSTLVGKTWWLRLRVGSCIRCAGDAIQRRPGTLRLASAVTSSPCHALPMLPPPFAQHQFLVEDDAFLVHLFTDTSSRM
jgi:hypothetical protein